ncbi:MAG: carboxymuconolactone decarboxylase family protein [Pseudomonadota bacterium]|nr:carboxymuconolactone decarboxylase family protein [Pseudomonadales bacterium]MEE3289804.1 carboxymuconolactone decarboxylase family protein [Pseudomonadota bacterium]
MKNKSALFTLLVLFSVISTDLLITIKAQEVQYELQGIQTQDRIPDDIHMDSLARLPQVQRENLNTLGRSAFDTYVRPGTGYETGLRGPVGMWMHSPVLAEAVFDLRQRVRYGTPKDQRLTELIILTTAREISNQYEWSAHEPLGQAAGLEQDIIEVIKYRKDLDSLPSIEGFDEIEQTLVQFTRELVSEEKVSTPTFNKAIELFGNEGVVDIVGLVGYYNFVAMTLKAFDVQRPVGSELLLPLSVN